MKTIIEDKGWRSILECTNNAEASKCVQYIYSKFERKQTCQAFGNFAIFFLNLNIKGLFIIYRLRGREGRELKL
jgi:hypothetical protein